MPSACNTSGDAPSVATFTPSASPTLRALRAERWPRPGPVGVRSRIASISARRTVLSATWSAGKSSCRKLIRAFDVYADRAGIHVRGRREHAADWRAVARVRVRIEHEIG